MGDKDLFAVYLEESGNDYIRFLDSSVGKVSVCNAGDPHLIPGSGRSPGEGIGYPLQYSWASFVAQLVKNPPSMVETWVQSLGWEDPLEKGKAIHSSVLAWRIPSTEQFMGGLKESDTTEQRSLLSNGMVKGENNIGNMENNI